MAAVRLLPRLGSRSCRCSPLPAHSSPRPVTGSRWQHTLLLRGDITALKKCRFQARNLLAL